MLLGHALEHMGVHPVHGIDMPEGDAPLLGGKAQGQAALLGLACIVGLRRQLIPGCSNDVSSFDASEPLADRELGNVGWIYFRSAPQGVE